MKLDLNFMTTASTFAADTMTFAFDSFPGTHLTDLLAKPTTYSNHIKSNPTALDHTRDGHSTGPLREITRLFD